MPNDHISTQFDARLALIRAKVLQMGGAVEDQLSRALLALEQRDTELVDTVLEAELGINALEVEIDELCTNVIARRTPTAVDLRSVIMAVKAVGDLERTGDEAKKIALIAREFAKHGCASILDQGPIRHMSARVAGMLHEALDAFARLDAEAAPRIARSDLEVDGAFGAILRELLTYMIEDPRSVSTHLDVIFVAKALERVGDHAKNICGYVVYMTMGKDVRHLSVDDIEQAVKYPQ